MVMCADNDFYAHPLLSPHYRLTSESAVELKKPPRSIIRPNICVYNNFLYACGGVFDRSIDSMSSARCFRSVLHIYEFLSIVCKMLFMHNSLSEFLRLDSVTALAFKFSCILWNHPTDGS